MADVNGGALAVNLTNLMQAGIHDALARVESVQVSGRTLVDSIPQADWDAWDGSGETALVADSDGLESVEIDDEVVRPAA